MRWSWREVKEKKKGKEGKTRGLAKEKKNKHEKWFKRNVCHRQ